MTIKHPAKYTDSFIPIFAKILEDSPSVLDPFGGTGKLGEIKDFGYEGEVFCSEIEKEWADLAKENRLVDHSFHGDSSKMSWAKDNSFHAICTSPTYGNRIADHYTPKDKSRRITYRVYLGRDLHERNSGRMQWGEKYRQVHRDVYAECARVLMRDGIFVLNVSDHIRKGRTVPVSAWHREALEYLGFFLSSELKIGTPRHRHGENSNVRVSHENIMVFKKL